MVHLVKKLIKGKIYLYLEERTWIEGKSKRTSSIYLGPENKIHQLNAITFPENLRYESIDFGLSMALYKIADKIEFIKTIDSVCGKSRDQNLSLGEYILLAVLQRCCQPGSKSQISSWFKHDFVSNLFTINPEILNSQTYWNHFQYFREENIEEIEQKLLKEVINKYKLNLRSLLFDPTNFFTFLTYHTQDDLAQNGHSKEGRANLRIINVSMLSTLEDGIPLFHMTYKGNTQDAKHFKAVISKIHSRFEQYEQPLSSLVLIFDKGNHSPDAFKQIDTLELPFIASLRNSTQKDLLEIPENSFTSIELPNNKKKVLYYTLQREVYGKNRILYVTLDLKKQNKQRILFNKKMLAKQEKLKKFIDERLNKKKWRSQENVDKKLQRIIGKFPFKDIIKYEITGNFATLKVILTIMEEMKERYLSSLGRLILFTNVTTWEPITIIQAFRDKYIIEDIFRRLKNPHYLSIRPMYHWNNTCVRVHVFCCFLGFLLLSLLRKELKQASIQTSYDEIFETFSTIKVTKINLSSKDKPLLKFNRMNQRAKEFFDTLKLKSFLPE